MAEAVKKKFLKSYSKNGVEVWIVNGELVRFFFFIDFTEGGHGFVYPFVPKNEVWLDDDLNPRERKFVLLHELHERNLMSKWMNGKKSAWKRLFVKNTYKKAHADSSAIEYKCRNGQANIDEELRKETLISRV
jgi:hypothetical protein